MFVGLVEVGEVGLESSVVWMEINGVIMEAKRS